MADLGMVRILGRAAACVVADVVAGARGVAVDYMAALRVDLPTGVGDYDGPVGEYPEVPLIVRPGGEDSCRKSSSSAAEVSAPVPGGGSPAAAGDHSTSVLLDAAARDLNDLACHVYPYAAWPNWIDDRITDLHERAEACRAVEAMTRPLGDLIADASDELLHRAYDDEPANPAFLQRLSRDLFAAARLVRAITPDLSGGASKVDSPAKRGP